MKINKHYIFSLLSMVFLLTSCAYQPENYEYDAPGFFSGLWHGFIILFSFFGSLFMDDVRIYAYPNSGIWYDLGFLIGCLFFSTAVSGSAKDDKK